MTAFFIRLFRLFWYDRNKRCTHDVIVYVKCTNLRGERMDFYQVSVNGNDIQVADYPGEKGLFIAILGNCVEQMRFLGLKKQEQLVLLRLMK